jgi:polygalacturonase
LVVLSCLLPLAAFAAPAITLQPVSQSALAGADPSFNVIATGTAPITYQWQKNGVPISGANASFLTLGNVQSANAGSYNVTVSNTSGSITSNTAVLTIVASATAYTPPVLPTIPTTVFNVTTYGAVGDGATNNTVTIQAALTAAKNAGGGIVEIPPASATYLCGPLTISSNTNLRIDSGATLQMLPYNATIPTPAGYYPVSGSAYPDFIEGSNVHDVEISGLGKIDGQGSPWWTAYNANTSIPHRPYMIYFSGVSRLLVTGVTLTNSPMFHLAPNGSNITVFNITISTSSSSPNTDGIDPGGTNLLFQSCTISDGDDNIAVKPGNSFCGNVTIANCAFGAGHGVSVGGQTNDGLNGMLVTNCTFTSTTNGLRMKADPTEGGPVTNVTYSNLTMTGVTYPILVYSYYNEVGTPGATSGSSQTTAAKVNSWNATPPNALNTSTMPSWTNITMSNITATGAGGYSTIWGLPLPAYYIANLTLNKVSISGGKGFEIFDATNVQVTGNSSLGGYVTCNALAVTTQPAGQTINSGANVTFTAGSTGTSGVTSTAPTCQWNLNGVALANGTHSDGSVVSGATTTSLTLTNAQAAEAGNYTAVFSNHLDAYNTSNSTLVDNSALVTATSSAALLIVIPPYTTWVTSYGLNLATTGAATADPSGNGIPNLVEYALGGNPTVTSTTNLPTSTYTTVDGVPSLVFEFYRSKSAVTALTETVQSSTDLINWTTVVNGLNGATITISTANSTTDQVTVTLPLDGNLLFARLQVSD